MAEQKQTGLENVPESSEIRQQDAPVLRVCGLIFRSVLFSVPVDG